MENYPELKSNQNVEQLMVELQAVKISFVNGDYNKVIEYNQSWEVFQPCFCEYDELSLKKLENLLKNRRSQDSSWWFWNIFHQVNKVNQPE